MKEWRVFVAGAAMIVCAWAWIALVGGYPSVKGTQEVANLAFHSKDWDFYEIAAGTTDFTFIPNDGTGQAGAGVATAGTLRPGVGLFVRPTDASIAIQIFGCSGNADTTAITVQQDENFTFPAVFDSVQVDRTGSTAVTMGCATYNAY